MRRNGDDRTMELSDIKAHATRLSPWAHLATVGANGVPNVTPVHPCWEGDTLWILVGTASVKAKDVVTNPNVALHWQVTADGDGVELWGTAEVFDDLATKQRLWTGVFDYDLDAFAPGGADNSPGMVFMAITPTKALYLEMYGVKGSSRWRAS